eukprot:20139-Pelagococcus_subviridis.AAC.2
MHGILVLRTFFLELGRRRRRQTEGTRRRLRRGPDAASGRVERLAVEEPNESIPPESVVPAVAAATGRKVSASDVTPGAILRGRVRRLRHARAPAARQRRPRGARDGEPEDARR